MTYEEVMQLFDQQMNIVKLKLNRSFRAYATSRDETIEYFSQRTGIPKQDFEHRLLREQLEYL